MEREQGSGEELRGNIILTDKPTMTPDKFIEKAQAYYGRYNTEQRETVRQWLQQKSPIFLPLVYAEVLKLLSATYKTPPGICELEQALRIVRTNRIDEIRPRYLPDPVDNPIDEATAMTHLALLCDMIGDVARAKKLRGEEDHVQK